MTHTQKITKWEAAFARYVAALAKFDDAYGKPRLEWNARRTMRAARVNMNRVDREVHA